MAKIKRIDVKDYDLKGDFYIFVVTEVLVVIQVEV